MDYCHDINARHEKEAVTLEERQGDKCQILSYIVDVSNHPIRKGVRTCTRTQHPIFKFVSYMIHCLLHIVHLSRPSLSFVFHRIGQQLSMILSAKRLW